MLDKLRELIEDGKASRRESSRKALEQLLQLPVKDRVEVTQEDLDELTADDKKAFFESLVGVENIKVGFSFREIMTAMAFAGVFAALVVGFGVSALNAGKVRLSTDDQMAIEFSRNFGLAQTIEDVGVEAVARRLSLSTQAADLAREFSQVEERMSKVSALSRSLEPDDWIDVARYISETGSDGVEFARFVTNLDYDDGTNNFIRLLFRRIPAFDEGTARPDWAGAINRLIAALAVNRDGELVFTSQSHDKVAVLTALESLDQVRRDAVIAVLKASDADMALVAERGLPLPLRPQERLAYDTLLSFDDPARQTTICLKGAERSDEEWRLMDWALTEDGRTGKLIMDASAHLSSRRTAPRPCLEVLMPDTPEWTRAGAWSRLIDGERQSIPICVMELPRPLLPAEAPR